jgi:hypothetical protein
MESGSQYAKFRSIKSNAILFLVCLLGIFVILFATNLDIFCLPTFNRIVAISNEELFLIYTVIFTIINILLLNFCRNLELSKSRSKLRRILFAVALINQLMITSILFIIYGEIKLASQYYNILFYIIIYSSLISSSFFLGVAGIQFLRWFAYGKNYLVVTYGAMMLVFCVSSIIGIVYLSEVSQSHPATIRQASCSAMFGSLHNINPQIVTLLTNVYDIASFFSFVLAWIATAFMLKEYSKGKSKIAYWFVIILPLIFFLSRYELALYYFFSNQAENILAAINVSPEIYGYDTLEAIINSNLQIGGAFFGIAFLAIAIKLKGRPELRNALILTGIGMMFLFASKDISTLIISSYPPLGAVSIAFVGFASYLIYLGISITATLTARDKRIRNVLKGKVEKNMMLLKSIASSQDKIEIEKNVKQLLNLTSEIQETNQQQNMTQEEMRELVKDVISEIKTTKKDLQ